MLGTFALVSFLTAATPQPTDTEAKLYTLDTENTTRTVTLPKKGRFSLKIRPAPGYKINREGPLSVEVAGEGLSLEKASFKQDDSKDRKSDAPEFESGFTAATAGKKSLKVTAVFIVCDDRICERKSDEVTISVTVSAH